MKGTDFQIKVWNLLSRIPFVTSLASVNVVKNMAMLKYS